MKTYVCRRIRLYSFLTERGFIPFKKGTDKDDPKRNVWLYEWTDNLDSAITEYYSFLK